MMVVLAFVSRVVDRVVAAYIEHCQRMDAWDRRARRRKAQRRLAVR